METLSIVSTTVSFLAVLLLSIISLVAAGKTPYGEVEPLCAKTPYPEFCESSIVVHPESKTTDDKQELVYWAVNSAYDFAARASMATKESKEPCTVSCHANFVWASREFSLAMNKYPDYDAMIKDVRNLLDEAKKKKVEWNCEKCPGEKIGDMSRGNSLEKMMEVMSAFANPK